jgi:hypothetical protein
MKCLHRFFLFTLLNLGLTPLEAQDPCGIAWGPIINLSGDDPNAFIPHVAVQGDTLHVTWWGGGYRLPYRRSLDGGATWQPTREMISDTSVAFAHYPWVIADSRFVYLVFAKATPQGVSPVCFMKSSDRGSSWSLQDSISDEPAGMLTNVFLRGDTIVVQVPRPSPHDPYCLFRTTNGGTSWDTSLVPARGQTVIGGGAFHNARGGIFPGHGQEVSYKRSMNLGDSWQDSVVLSGLDDEWSNDARIAASDENPPRIFVMWRDTKYGCLAMVGCSIIMRASGDGGHTWGEEYLMTDSPVGYNWDRGQQIATSGEKVIAVWTNDQTGHINMRHSVNRGESWSLLCDVTPSRAATDPSCAITPSFVHVLWEDVITGTGAVHIYYRRGLILSDEVETPQSLPDGFSLLQNYPNPFNEQTRMDYTLRSGGSRCWVTFRVFDLLGREVAQLVNEQQEPGRHTVRWNAKSVSSGVYICRLSVFEGALPTRTFSRKMLLLK